MTIPTSQSDLEKISSLTLFRWDKLTFPALIFATGFFCLLVPWIPYYGWKRPPQTPPANIEEYIVRVAPYAIMVILMGMIPFLNWLFRKIEASNGTKRVIEGTVSLAVTLPFRRKLILFKPSIPPIIFRRGELMRFKKGNRVVYEVTVLGRLINIKDVS